MHRQPLSPVQRRAQWDGEDFLRSFQSMFFQIQARLSISFKCHLIIAWIRWWRIRQCARGCVELISLCLKLSIRLEKSIEWVHLNFQLSWYYRMASSRDDVWDFLITTYDSTNIGPRLALSTTSENGVLHLHEHDASLEKASGMEIFDRIQGWTVIHRSWRYQYEQRRRIERIIDSIAR